VKGATAASGSKPRSDTKKDRTLPAKSHMQKVEVHPQNNKNDHFGAIMSYGDYMIGDSVISKVYYVKGLGHNLFSVGQFYDFDLEVAFRNYSCYVRDTDGVELLKGSCGSNLYTISVEDMMKSSLICLLSKAFKNKSWLWHHRLNHLNFGTINDLARKDLVRGLPRLKFEKDHLCSACQLEFSSKISFEDSTAKRRCRRMKPTPYELVHDKKPDLTFLQVFGALCYPTNDSKDHVKLQPTADIRIFIGYAPSMSWLSVPIAPYVPPTNKDLEVLFQPMFDEYLEPPHVERQVSPTPAVPIPVSIAGTPSSTTIDQDAPSPKNPLAPVDNDPFVNVFTPEPSSEASSSGNVSSAAST
nr:integrase, catalytic region, zinc finger, CCHC-type, peptidase aspartic, catalytic [Tanacetum cinerariifolium]